MPKTLERSILIALACLISSLAFADAPKQINVPAGDLLPALESISKQADVELVFQPEQLKGLRTKGVNGVFSSQEAIKKLLEGTPLELRTDETTGAMMIGAAGSRAVARTTSLVRDGRGTEGEGTLRLAQNENNQGSQNSDTSSQSEKNSSETSSKGSSGSSEGAVELQEIIVTATKRLTSLQDTPMSVSVVGAKEIEQRGLVGMGDYLNSLPSITVLDQGAGRTSIVMRGLAANAQTDTENGPLVGVYFGETPISGFASGSFGGTADIKMVDLERVEVLRGPQGTLYGASSLGGTVRNIPASPNLHKFAANLRLGASNTAGLGSGNSEFRGVLNIPMANNTLAVRLVGYRFENSGYYRNVAASDPVTTATAAAFGATVVNKGDIGADEYTGGRVAVLWQPTEQLAVKLNYLKQEIDQNGWPQADLELGAGAFLQRRLQVRRPEGAPDFGAPMFNEEFADDIEIPSAVLEYDLGWASLLSSSSWIEEDSRFLRDLTGTFGVPWDNHWIHSTDAFVQELRLVSRFGGPAQFVAGLYYEDVDLVGDNWGGIWGGDLALNPFGPQLALLHNLRSEERQQKAVFGELSYALSSRLKLTAGARVFSYDRKVTDLLVDNIFGVPAPGTVSVIESDESDVSYKAGLDFSPDVDTLIYASWSEGFRLGRPLPPDEASVCDVDGDGFFDGSDGVPIGVGQIDSDYVDSIELGAKRSFLNNRLRLSGSLFQSDWQGLPIFLQFDVCSTYLNAGKAKSRGAEFEGSYYVGEDLSLSLGASYVHGELDEDAPFLGEAGDRLPGAPKYNYHLGLQYEFSIVGTDAFVRGDYSHIGGFYNNLQELGPKIGNYGLLNLRAGVSFGTVGVDVFVNNATNENALTWVDSEGLGGQRGNLLRPRTMGLSLTATF